MATTYRRHTLNNTPLRLADGGHSPRLVVTEHRAEEAVDHVIDLGPDVYRTAQEAAQAAMEAGVQWVDSRLGPLHRHEGFGLETSATSHEKGWTGEVRIYGSSSDTAIFDRRTNYIAAPGVFRDDGQARDAAQKHAIDLIDAGEIEWEDR
ncbi:hypothetical protein [Cupriavidus necator]|uniref:hypothetical protein n=1 Tax=Cupriavidus necator TaxID=106590 RepID=UPI0030F448AC